MSLTPPLRDTPVALFVFNRPAHTRLVVEAIAAARPPKLLVVADGPRPDNDTDEALCAETREVIASVPWSCDVLTNYADANLGCRRRVASGLDWVFAQSDAAIIIEDDCLPDASFFPFCEELLTRYADDDRVHMISGSNVVGRGVGDASYYFSRGYKIWGWASWARAWAHYDLDMARWPELRDSGWLERFLPSPVMAAIARGLFEDAFTGRAPTWDYQWAFAGWADNALAITPAENLVANIGHGPDGSHLRDPDHRFASLPTTSMRFPLVHPTSVEVPEALDLEEWTLNYPRAFGTQETSLASRVRRRVRGLFA
jgi:hypothetical protein